MQKGSFTNKEDRDWFEEWLETGPEDFEIWVDRRFDDLEFLVGDNSLTISEFLMRILFAEKSGSFSTPVPFPGRGVNGCSS